MNSTSINNNLKRSNTTDDGEPPPIKSPKVVERQKTGAGHWTQGLKQALQNQDNIIFETDHVSVIKDKYPKAKYHFLVIAKGDISSIKSLKYTHISLLQHMIHVGKNLRSYAKIEPKEHVKFKMGFHAVPSMTLMHMHVISTDFDSPHLKNKRHWNSFTSEFFRPAEIILKELEDKGFISIDGLYYKQMLESSLKCHMCDAKPRNIPRLKEHIRTHFPSS